MRNGKKRHQIVIQTIPRPQSATGAAIAGTPVTFATLWAAILPLGGEMNLLAARESFGAGRQYAEAQHRIETDYVDGVTPAMQVACSDGGTFDGRTFDIQSVNPVAGRNREMHLIVKERRTSATP
jgi:head-tail adaptor